MEAPLGVRSTLRAPACRRSLLACGIAAVVGALLASMFMPSGASADPVATTPGAGATFDAPAATAPTTGAEAVEGGKTTFEWQGELQGDAAAIGQSFFRLEIAKSSAVPSGQQSAWTDLENFAQTTATSRQMGVPSAGSYKWRVCAWGVADSDASNEVVQLSGGCSAARSLVVVAATVQNRTIGELPIRRTVTVVSEPRVVVEDQTSPVVPDVPVETEEPTQDSIDVQRVATNDEQRGSSSVGLAENGLTSEGGSNRGGLGGALVAGLSATFPGIPIPFWTLAVLLLCVPIARVWRNSVRSMFAADTVMRAALPGDRFDDLANVPDARSVKDRDGGSDTTGPDALPPVHKDGGIAA